MLQANVGKNMKLNIVDSDGRRNFELVKHNQNYK